MMIGKLLTLGAFALICTSSFAIEKKAIAAIDSDEFTTDTQPVIVGAGDSHVAVIWWIPNEFWDSILTRDESVSAVNKKAILDSMANVSLMAVVQADVDDAGSFNFYSKEKVQEKMRITHTDASGEMRAVPRIDEVNEDLKVVLGIFKPILTAAMGGLGANMHFYVLDDKSENPGRLTNPYNKGNLHIDLERSDGGKVYADIGTPINALYVPRKCPNGKNAHVSWLYCPWSGEKLAE